MANERRTVHFEGDVQGVGFRYTACRVAGQFEVTGYVRNLPDGRVEVVVEGPTHEIDAFLTELRRRMEGYVSGTTQQTATCTGGFRSFTVRY
jgi:acylphosphatase